LMAIDIGRDVYIRPEDRKKAVERYRMVGRYDAIEVDWKRKDGTPITVWLSGRPVRDDSGNVQYFEMIAEDVTERRMLEDQLRQVQKMEAIGQLTGGIAHDFNNLLTVISANAEIVAESLPEDLYQLRGDVEDLLAAAERGTALVKKLLGFGRQAMLDMQPVDLVKLVSDTAAMVRRIVPENIEMDIVPSGQVSSIMGDPLAIEQILLNLATNARDAMPEGGALRIEIADQRVDQDFSMLHPGLKPGLYACVTVSDTGIGMSTDTKEHIFEPFFTKKPHGLGTGLGMAMVYGLVKQLSGYVNVVSEPHTGTTVRLYFPVPEATPLADAGHDQPNEKQGGHETILVVEDEKAIRRTIKRALESQGYTVLLAEHGEEALELLHELDYKVDMIISDLVMPKIGGRQLYETLEQDGKHTRFLFTSGYATTEVGRSSNISSNVPLLTKPWTLSDLFARIREVLDRA
ncbi:MAG: response regulator, partial [Gemmatimonadota bacterium]